MDCHCCKHPIVEPHPTRHGLCFDCGRYIEAHYGLKVVVVPEHAQVCSWCGVREVAGECSSLCEHCDKYREEMAEHYAQDRQQLNEWRLKAETERTAYRIALARELTKQAIVFDLNRGNRPAGVKFPTGPGDFVIDIEAAVVNLLPQFFSRADELMQERLPK